MFCFRGCFEGGYATIFSGDQKLPTGWMMMSRSLVWRMLICCTCAAARIQSREELFNFVRDPGCVYANRVLVRRAVAADPKARTVLDAAYATSLCVGTATKPQAEVISRGRHPSMKGLDAITHVPYFATLMAENRG